jgi:diguanylate cyclase (GGDEF)-like protein
MSSPFALLAIGDVPDGLAASSWGPFNVTPSTLEAAPDHLRERHFDAVLLHVASAEEADRVALWPALSHATLDAAVMLLTPSASPTFAARLLKAGVQDVQAPGPVETLGRSLRLAIERKRLEQAARKAYATDLATGLPNHSQLIEHMSHLLALREREPAPMALLAFRIEGLATVAASLGTESANVVRRKAAVRLRAGLRASDVVASIGHDAFAVLLAWIDAPADGQRVVAKLVQAMQQPFSVAGSTATLAVSAGVSHYPEDGKEAGELMRRAIGQAAGMAPMGREGFANRVERGPAAAANDE